MLVLHRYSELNILTSDLPFPSSLVLKHALTSLCPNYLCLLLCDLALQDNLPGVSSVSAFNVIRMPMSSSGIAVLPLEAMIFSVSTRPLRGLFSYLTSHITTSFKTYNILAPHTFGYLYPHHVFSSSRRHIGNPSLGHSCLFGKCYGLEYSIHLSGNPPASSGSCASNGMP